MYLNQQAQHIHHLNHKWWHDRDGNRLTRNRGELLMLVVSEISEAMEALRKDLMDDKLPHRKGEEVELADAYIRLLDYAAGMGVKLYDDDCTRDKPYGENKAEQLLEIVERVTWVWFQDRDDDIMAAIAAVIDYAHRYDLDLDGAVREKLDYNQLRADHTYEAREAVGGKKF